MCFKFGAVNSGLGSSSEKAKLFEVTLKSELHSCKTVWRDTEIRTTFLWRHRNAAGSGSVGAEDGDAVTAELLCQGGREGTGQSTVTWPHRRYLRLVSSSRVRSTTSVGEDQLCWGATAVHGCAGWALAKGELRFQEDTLWITPPLGWTHLQGREGHTHTGSGTLLGLATTPPPPLFCRYLLSTSLSKPGSLLVESVVSQTPSEQS